MQDLSHTLSNRGAQLSQKLARIDLDLLMDAYENQYDTVSNPEGAFPLTMAENALSSAIIKDKMDEILHSEKTPDWIMKYTDALGHPDVREVMARFMNGTFGTKSINQGNICFSAGASASLEVASYALANPGDLVVIPSPSYPMYTSDLGLKNSIERYDLHTHYDLEGHDSLAKLTLKMLDNALEDINHQGKTFKVLLLTSPDNPGGFKYSEDQFKGIATWCVDHKIHLMVNEIYALSLVNNQGNTEKETSYHFEFWAKIMADFKSPYLHLIYGLSKDFCMSGLRFGIIHSLNPSFIKSIQNINIPHMVSNLTQWLVGELFKNEAFISHFIKENQAALKKSYRHVTQSLAALSIPYIPAQGSLFVWADFSAYLRENNDNAELTLWQEIYQNTGILLTPGIGFRHQKKGLFRIVYSAIPYDHLVVAFERLKGYFGHFVRQ